MISTVKKLFSTFFYLNYFIHLTISAPRRSRGMNSKIIMKRNLLKKLLYFKKWLFKLKLPNLITILLLSLIWLYKERQDSDEQLDDLLELNNESKPLYYFKVIRNKIINFVTFIIIPSLIVIYNLADIDLFQQLAQFGQDNFIVSLLMNLYKLFTNREDEFDELSSEDADRLYKKHDRTIEKLPFEMENLRLEFKKELKRLQKTVDTLTQDNQQFRDLTGRFKANNQAKLETFEKKIVQIINDELDRVKATLIDKNNKFQQKYSFLDPTNYEKFCEMFETVDVTVDLIRRRDQQLKDLFKITTEINLKSELVGLHFLC